MNVEINLASNQVLTNNGVYNVIQGQNGLEFQRVQQRSRGLPDPTGTSIGQFNVNVKIQLSINDFKLLNEVNSAFSFNKRNINWNYNIDSSQGTYSALAYFYECQDFYKIGIIRVDDGGSYDFTRRSDAIGNYMFETTISGTVGNGQTKVYCQNKALLYMYNFGNVTGDRVESEILLYKDNYKINGFN